MAGSETSAAALRAARAAVREQGLSVGKARVAPPPASTNRSNAGAGVIYDARRDVFGGADERGGGKITFQQLRMFADNCDACRDAIGARTAQVLTTPLKFRARPGVDDAAAAAQILAAEEFFSTKGGFGGPGTSWEETLQKLCEDALTLGCLAMFRRQNLGGTLFSVEPFDAATIKPVLETDGRIPADGIAYEQWISGKRTGVGFRADEIHYRRLNARTSSRWGRSPVEFVMAAILQYIGYDTWNLAWVNDGDGELGHWEVPDDYSDIEREKLEAIIRAMRETPAKRQRGSDHLFPPGVKWTPRRQRAEADFVATQTFLIRRIAAGFQINATIIGFAGEQYKVSQDEQVELAEGYGGSVFKITLKSLVDDILHDDLLLDLVECGWEEKAADMPTVAGVVQTVGTERISVNAARAMLNERPAEGPYVDCLYHMTTAGEVIVIGWDAGKKPKHLDDQGRDTTAPPPPPVIIQAPGASPTPPGASPRVGQPQPNPTSPPNAQSATSRPTREVAKAAGRSVDLPALADDLEALLETVTNERTSREVTA